MLKNCFFLKQLFSKSLKSISFKLQYLKRFDYFPTEVTETFSKAEFLIRLKKNFKNRQQSKTFKFSVLRKTVVEAIKTIIVSLKNRCL